MKLLIIIASAVDSVAVKGQVPIHIEVEKMDGDTKCEWFEEKRLALLERAGKASRP